MVLSVLSILSIGIEVFGTSSIMLFHILSICSIGAHGGTLVRRVNACLIGAHGGTLVRCVSICSTGAYGRILVRPISICSIFRSVDIRRANVCFGQTSDQLLKHPINMFSLKIVDAMDIEIVWVLFSMLFNELVALLVWASV